MFTSIQSSKAAPYERRGGISFALDKQKGMSSPCERRPRTTVARKRETILLQFLKVNQGSRICQFVDFPGQGSLAKGEGRFGGEVIR